MGVEVLGVPSEGNGYGDTMDAFRDSHKQNSRILVNLAMGRKKNAETPPYDPAHASNKFPAMVYHAARGEKIVESEHELNVALKDGYRKEPYAKPQIAVLDPASEKKALLDRNQELQGQIVAQGDQIAKLQAAVEALASGKSDASDEEETENEPKPKAAKK